MFSTGAMKVPGLRRCLLAAAIHVATLLSAVSVAISGSSERVDLDQIWNEHMLDGRAALIVLDKGSEWTTETGPVADLTGGRLKAALTGSHGITVHRVGKGIWTNGGWILRGGRLGRIELDSLTYELFGKEVIRRIPYFPFPFHRDPPHESGCEFFLVRREKRDSRATVVRQWEFLPTDVMLNEFGSTDISATMTREPGSQAAVITVHGLKTSFRQRIDLAS